MFWLAWICFIEKNLHNSSPPSQLLQIDFDGALRLWLSKVGSGVDVYHFLASLAHPKSIPSYHYICKPQYCTDSDLEKDFEIMTMDIAQILAVEFIVLFKRHLRDLLATDQDKAALSEEKESQRLALGNGNINQFGVLKNSETAWEALINYLKDVYRDRPDSALDWWTNHDLFNFLKMASGVWTPRFITSFLELVTELSCGPASAIRAHDVLNSEQQSYLGQVLWITFFRTLGNYVDGLGRLDAALELPLAEIGLIHAFLRLVSQVVKYSFTARRVLCENQNFRALSTLMFLLVSRLPLETKAVLFETIAAFCTPCAEGYQIVQQIWYFNFLTKAID